MTPSSAMTAHPIEGFTMPDDTATLTANSTIRAWLDHPVGGPLIRGLLTQAGVGDEVLGPISVLPLQQMVTMSQGQMPQSIVDELVLQANGGVMPETAAASGWAERSVPERFSGKTVVVTGAASGIGRATAARVAREGGRVIAVDISADRLGELVESLPDAEIVPVVGDITKQEDIDAIIAAAGATIDALANVAGINDDFSPLHETSDAIWDRVIAINLTGGFKLSRAVIPVMLERGEGAIVNVASEAGLRGNASGNAYTVSKHGVIGLTRSAAFMYGAQGLRINAVAPGGVATGIPMPAHPSEFGTARLSPFQGQIPSIATAEKLAASITFLLSDDAVNINGVVLPSDGGWSVQ
jgi:NAD(P)-dependent dehydrogenase (short-subunit alcohol dehydrogenase family)